ncbi:ubiquinone biosynthesis accessory factor UbiJ [Dokdonella soli]|uniref:Ubiquinone biosynthesis accessory factor UbiJ n=1 Tax=Dokdonella soli TaxID=529810 RepID=A0ABP3TKN1_9GAMM
MPDVNDAGSAGPQGGAARSPNPLLAVLGRVLETALNRALDLDPDTKAQVAALDGRAITLEFKGTPLAMRVTAEHDRLAIGPAFAGVSALRIAATPAALLSLAWSRDGGALPPGRVEIAGDAELARRLEQIATRFAPDFDAAFARAFGDVAGFQIARTLRRAFAWSRTSARAFAQDSVEFLTEEGRDLVAKPEVETFLDEVDALRERADRLDARVHRLAAQRGNPRA